MKKLTDFLEKNCQWLAIGAGALWLLYMVYSFLLTSAVWQVPVANEPKSPGEVDEAVAKIADQLKSQMDASGNIKIPVPDFNKATDVGPAKTQEYSIAWANSPTQEVQLPTAQGTGTTPTPNGPVAKGTNNAAKVIELPKAPAATDLAVSSGRSNVVIPPPPNAVATGGDANNPPPAPAPADQTASTSDIDWISIAYKIPMGDLAKEFQRTVIPTGQQQGTTCFLDVELVREEMQPDGTWGQPTVCPKLSTSTQPPFPADNTKRQDLQPYLNWAVGATVEILQPKFYDVAKGDPWTLSKDYVGTGTVGDNGAPLILGPNDVRPGFDPTQFATTDPKALPAQEAAMQPPLTMHEKQLISKARSDAAAKAAAEKSKSRSPSGGGTSPGGRSPGGYGGPGGGRGGNPNFAPEDGARPAYPPQARLGAAGGDMMPGNGPGYGQPMQQQQSNYSQLFPLPQNGEFDPRTLTAGPAANPNAPPTSANMTSLVGWAHDWKTEPGKTYRYMIRYKIKNPVWATINVAKDKAMADVFAITSAESAWTDPIQAPPIVQFFFISAGGEGRATRVEIFKYENGSMHKETFDVYPGDAIGGERSNIDYSTGNTLVLVRQDLIKTDRPLAWLITPESMLVKHDVKTDMDSPQRADLEKQVQAAAAAAANAAGGNPPNPALINPVR
jgi:hypothetical protein